MSIQFLVKVYEELQLKIEAFHLYYVQQVFSVEGSFKLLTTNAVDFVNAVLDLIYQ